MSAYSAAVLADNPLTYWRLSETSSNFINLGSAATADLDIGGTFTRGVASLLPQDAGNAAVTYNGGSSSTSTNFLDTSLAASTVEFWISAVGPGQISNGVYYLTLSGAGPFTVNRQNGNATWANAISAGVATYFVLVSNLTTASLYIGTTSVAPALVSTVSCTPSNNGNGIRIGALNGVQATPINATFDEFAIYSSALSLSQMTTHWTAATQSAVVQVAGPGGLSGRFHL